MIILERYVKAHNNGMLVMGVPNNFVTESKPAAQEETHLCCGQSGKNLQLMRSYALCKYLILLFCQLDTVSIAFLADILFA